MNFFTFTKLGRTLLLAAVLVVGTVCVSYGDGGNPSELAGRWVRYEGTDGDFNKAGYYRVLCENIELFSDGTGVVDGDAVTWKAENKRLRLLSPSQAIVADYNVSGYELILVYDERRSARFMKKEHFEEYKKKNAEETKRKADEAKRIKQLEEQVDMYNEKDMYDKAIELCTEIIRIAPKSALGYVKRGVAYNNKDDYDRAIADYTMALKLDAESPERFFKLGGILYYRGNSYRNKGDYDKALADLNKAVQLDPNDEDYYNERGYVYLEKGDYNKALADFNKAVQLAPNEANPYDSRGEAYLKMGDYDKAIADYSKALRLDPTMESAKEGLAEARKKKKGR